MGGYDIRTVRRLDRIKGRGALGKAVGQVLYLHLILGCTDNIHRCRMGMVVMFPGNGFVCNDKFISK